MNIAELRELCKQTVGGEKRERFDFSLQPGGFPRGAITELAGLGKTEIFVQFLSENPKLRVAWIEDELTIYPCAVAQRGVSLSRVLFIEAHEDILWATFQVLRSHLFDCVVLSSLKTKIEENNLRRLQLESEKGNAGVFLLTEELHRAWPIALQINVHRGRGESAAKLKLKRERA